MSMGSYYGEPWPATSCPRCEDDLEEESRCHCGWRLSVERTADTTEGGQE